MTSPAIQSLQNPRVKRIAKLRERRSRDKEQCYLIEGYRELLRAQEAEVPVDELFICSELFLGENEQDLIRIFEARGTKILSCSKEVFGKISYRDRPDGLLAIAPQQRKGLDALAALLQTLQRHPLILVAEAIEKPGNLGTILRSCDAAGADALIVCDRCTDTYHPTVVRASVGTLFTVPVFEADSASTLAFLRQQQIQILAATPQAQALYTNVPLTGPLAIAVGTEQLGLSEAWMGEADLQVAIPMRGQADSLNVATATTLLLYEVLRQRG
jgi:TrmH family RNA methyltransferase